MSYEKTDLVVELADRLHQASESKNPTRPLTDEYPNMAVEEAYAIQLYNIDRELNQGENVVGKKIGLTSIPMQELVGVDEPDYGHLLTNMVIDPDKGEIETASMLYPRIEGELAFILKEDLVGPNVTVEDVINATEYISPAIEVVDSRVENWQIKLQDTVADNGSSAYYILGDVKADPKELDRIGVQMKLYQNGELINEGKGSDVLGDPAYCVAWLANKLHAYDITLKKGEVVLSGALTKAIDAKVGDEFVCEFTEGLEKVTLKFT